MLHVMKVILKMLAKTNFLLQDTFISTDIHCMRYLH